MGRENEPDLPGSWARDHLANERTLLAWIRTALGFMAFGITVAKLGVLVRAVGIEHPEIQNELPSSARSDAMGTVLIMVGVVFALLGLIRTRRWAHRISPAGTPMPTQRGLIAVAAATVVLGLGLTVYVLV